jgi:hypothetical protein
MTELSLVPSSLNYCVECKHSRKGSGGYRCTRDRATQLNLVTGVYDEVPSSIKDCTFERGVTYSDEVCGRMGRFFESKKGVV